MKLEIIGTGPFSLGEPEAANSKKIRKIEVFSLKNG